MRQLTFDLAPPEPPSFTNFVAGGNSEALAALEAMARGALRENGVVLWGGAGVGKSHLLRATVTAALAAGREARYLPHPRDTQPEVPAAGVLIAVDNVDAADAAAQGRLFTLYNALGESGGQLLGASARAPARLALRDDLRTRLGHGLVYEVLPLADADK